MCTYLQLKQKRGGLKMNIILYPRGGGVYQKRGGSESQQKMNIQQEMGHIKKGED